MPQHTTMHIRIQTQVSADFTTVSQQFGQSLLTYVSPPFPPTRLLRYDGNEVGSEVHVELNFILFRQVWKSKIISLVQTATQMVFIDEGLVLPFFLSYWHHEHRVESCETGSCIVDNVQFRTPFILTDYLMYPLMYVQFWYRKPRYQKFFANQSQKKT